VRRVGGPPIGRSIGGQRRRFIGCQPEIGHPNPSVMLGWILQKCHQRTGSEFRPDPFLGNLAR
jgi:hypothetical protein